MFHPAPAPSQADVEAMVERASKRILRFLQRRGQEGRHRRARVFASRLPARQRLKSGVDDSWFQVYVFAMEVYDSSPPSF